MESNPTCRVPGSCNTPLNPLATQGVQALPQGQRLFLQQEYLKEQTKLIAAQKALADAKNKAAQREPTGVPINAETSKPVSSSASPSAPSSAPSSGPSSGPSSAPAPSSTSKTVPSWIAASHNQEAIKGAFEGNTPLVTPLTEEELAAIKAAAPRTEELYQNIDALEEKRNEIKHYARNLRRGGITQEERDELAKLREERQALEARVDALSPRTNAESRSAQREASRRAISEFGKEVLLHLTPIPGLLPARLAKGAAAGVGSLQRGAQTLRSSRVRVGRWMRQDELEKMQRTGRIVRNENKATHVTFPPREDGYRAYPKKSFFVTFDIDKRLITGTSDRNTHRIIDPYTIESRNAKRKGMTVDEKMPEVFNIKIERKTK